jgi:hypothetical protein
VEVQKRNLKPGDLVLFFAEDGEEDGYLCSDGVGEDRVVIKASKEKGTLAIYCKISDDSSAKHVRMQFRGCRSVL